MSRNINAKSNLLTTVQASGADAVVVGGQLLVTGVEPIELKKVSRSILIGTTGGNPRIQLITAAAITAGVTYSGVVEQRAEGELYRFTFNYVCPAGPPAAATFYAAIAALFQTAIDGNQILGTVLSSGSGVEFTPSVLAATPNLTLNGLSSATSNKVTVTSAGSSFSTGVLTSGAATNAVVGQLYLISFAAVGGADAARVNNKTFFAKALSPTTFFIYNLISASTLTTTGAATMTVANTSVNDQRSFLAVTNGYVETSSYIGYQIDFEETAALDSGIMQPQAIFLAASQTDANVNDLLLELTGYLDGSSASTVLNTI
jgi:hypothetical protein